MAVETRAQVRLNREYEECITERWEAECLFIEKPKYIIIIHIIYQLCINHNVGLAVTDQLVCSW